MSIILGIDPGTTDVGYAVLQKQGRNLDILDYGVFKTPANAFIGDKLVEIESDIQSLFVKYPICACGIEKLFFFKNQKTVIDVAQARGVIMSQVHKKGIPITEFSPPQIKKAISGNGNADKKQVQNALKIIFKLDEIPQPDDAADAIAIAYITALQPNLM